MSHATDTLEKIKVMQAYVDGAVIQIEVASSKIGETSWKEVNDPTWSWRDNNYRIKPATPDQIDWEHIAPRFKYCARDMDGRAFLFTSKPDAYVAEGVWRSGRVCNEVSLWWQGVFTQGDVPWNESLLIRNEEEN